MNKIKKAGEIDLTPNKDKAKKINVKRKKINKIKTSKAIKAKNKRIKAKAKQIKVKYQDTQRYVKFVSKSQLNKHIINGQYVFTKQQERQYNLLNKRFGLSRLDYLKFYYGVRKANVKGARLEKESALYHVKYATSGKRIMTREDFNKYMKSIATVLSRDYKEKKNRHFIRRFKQNIELILDDASAKRVIDIINGMTAKEIYDFIDENPDLEKVMYESNATKFTSFDKEATSLIESRLYDFLGYPEEERFTEEQIANLPF